MGELLRRVFAVDVLDCPRCHGRLELIAYIAEAGWRGGSWTTSGWRLRLRHSPARGQPTRGGRCEPGPDYGESDPVYEE